MSVAVVTGAAGLIGSEAVRHFASLGLDVVGIDNDMRKEFFGEEARMMGGPAALAVQTGAALMPVILWFEGDHWGVHVHE